MRHFLDLLREAATETTRAAEIVLRWVNEERNDTALWTKLFDSVRSTLDETVPDHPVMLWRNERTNDETQYARYTSWTTEKEIAQDYPANGGRNRRMVRALMPPEAIVCCVEAFGPRVDWLRQKEVIVRPGTYHRLTVS